MPTFQDFQELDLRTGTIIEAKIFDKALKPAYILRIDFGVLGIKTSSAQLTKRYRPAELIQKQIIAVVNFPPKQIANVMSECLVLGVIGDEGDVILLTTDQPSANGLKIG